MAKDNAVTDGYIVKRSNYIDWDTYFMGVAFLSAQRSKDPNTQVGACIVNSQNKIVGIGYNGMPKGCSDDEFPWCRTSYSNDPLESKYLYVCHAELNAVLNKISEGLENCRIYVPLFPCNECAKVIIQSGIKEVSMLMLLLTFIVSQLVKVIYLSDKYYFKPEIKASKRMLLAAKIMLRKFDSPYKKLTIDFTLLD